MVRFQCCRPNWSYSQNHHFAIPMRVSDQQILFNQSLICNVLNLKGRPRYQPSDTQHVNNPHII